MASKLVTLKFSGDLARQGFQVTLEVGQENERPTLEMMGALPPNLPLLNGLQQWRQRYHGLKGTTRIQPKEIVYFGLIHQVGECRKAAQTLRIQLQRWLMTSSFQALDQQLREELNREDSIRILIRTDDLHLQQMPWHLWDLVDRYPYAEVGISALFSQRMPPPTHALRRAQLLETSNTVRVLAILGHSEGIDIEVDQQLLETLPDTEITYLIEPLREQVNDKLWSQPWDILFFAGHSTSQVSTAQSVDAPSAHLQKGRFYINPTDSLSIEALKYGFRQVIANGLQLAIFNSCEGLGLSHELKSLGLPHMILMREPVPDRVAQTFLRYFLTAYASGLSLYLAERQAREKLQGLEDTFPCASWLPVMVHASPELPPTWKQLKQPDEETQSLPSSLPSMVARVEAAAIAPPLTPHTSLRRIWAARGGLMATFLVSAVRWLGGMQPLELQGFDWVMRQRMRAPTAQRILMVEATETDINTYGYPLPDEILAKAIAKLELHHPRVIGLDIFRDQLRPDNNPLKQAFQHTKGLVALCSIGETDNPNKPGIAAPPDISEDQLGFSNTVVDPDGVVRRQLMFMQPALNTACATPFSLSTLVAFTYLEPDGIVPQNLEQQKLQLGKTIFTPIEENTGPYHNIDSWGFQIFLNYEPVENFAQRMTLSELLSDEVPLTNLDNKAVLIGVTAPVSNPTDYFLTPDGAGQWPQEKISGVRLHAYMVNHLLVTALEGRGSIRSLPGWATYVWIASWALIGSLLAWRQPRVGLWGLSLVVSIVGLYALCWGVFVVGVWVPLVPAVLSLVLSSLTAQSGLLLSRR
ncbi:MAG: CHASE2 domain-containing protein [Cyanobacteria bacterium J06634_5]